MELEVNHGLSTSQFFLIAYPKKQYAEKRNCDGSTIVKLIDKINNTSYKASYYGCYEIEFDKMQDYNSYARLAYGRSAESLKPELAKKYPELTQPGAILEYWILKRIK